MSDTQHFPPQSDDTQDVSDFVVGENVALEPHPSSLPLLACVHEWRLIDERRSTYGALRGGYVEVRRWYCVHCRTIDVTDDHGGVK